MGDKTRNIAMQLVLEKCCKTICTLFCLFYRIFGHQNLVQKVCPFLLNNLCNERQRLQGLFYLEVLGHPLPEKKNNDK